MIKENSQKNNDDQSDKNNMCFIANIEFKFL